MLAENRETGVLLPFGSCLTQYNHANSVSGLPDEKSQSRLMTLRTLFDATSSMWLLKDSSDQQEGWRIEDVLESGAKHGVPK